MLSQTFPSLERFGKFWQIFGFINLKSNLLNRKPQVHGTNAFRDGNNGFQSPGWFRDTLLGGGPSHGMNGGESFGMLEALFRVAV